MVQPSLSLGMHAVTVCRCYVAVASSVYLVRLTMSVALSSEDNVEKLSVKIKSALNENTGHAAERTVLHFR